MAGGSPREAMGGAEGPTGLAILSGQRHRDKGWVRPGGSADRGWRALGDRGQGGTGGPEKDSGPVRAANQQREQSDTYLHRGKGNASFG